MLKGRQHRQEDMCSYQGESLTIIVRDNDCSGLTHNLVQSKCMVNITQYYYAGTPKEQ